MPTPYGIWEPFPYQSFGLGIYNNDFHAIQAMSEKIFVSKNSFLSDEANHSDMKSKLKV